MNRIHGWSRVCFIQQFSRIHKIIFFFNYDLKTVGRDLARRECLVGTGGGEGTPGTVGTDTFPTPEALGK